MFGAAIRLYNKIRMLGSFSDVSLLSYQSWTDEDSVAHLETLCREVVVIDAKPPDSKLQRVRSRSPACTPTSTALIAAPSCSGPSTRWWPPSDYDVVMVDLTPMGQFRLPDGPLRVLDLHNIEHELVERRAATARKPLRRATLGLEARKVRREELAICRRFDLLLTTSDRETEILRSWGMPHVETMVNTIDTVQAFTPPAGPRDVGPRLAFIGTTHVDANRDGVRYFMDEIFPLVREKVPEVEVDIVGGDPPAEIRAYDALPRRAGDRPGEGRAGLHGHRAGADRAAPQRRRHPPQDPRGPELRRADRLHLDRRGGPRPRAGRAPADRRRTPLVRGCGARACSTTQTLRARLRVAGRQFVEEHYDWRVVQDRLRTVIESTLAERALPSPA